MGNINKSTPKLLPGTNIKSNNHCLEASTNNQLSKPVQDTCDRDRAWTDKQEPETIPISSNSDNQADKRASVDSKLLPEQLRPFPTGTHMDIINRTWVKLKDNDELGSSLFLRMFQSYPYLQSAFGPLGDVTQDDSHYGDVLRAHGSRVLGIMKFLIEHWSNEDAVISHLHQLGQHHVILNAKVEYLDIVSQMFLFALEAELNTEWNSDVELAWGALLRFLTHVMKEQMTF